MKAFDVVESVLETHVPWIGGFLGVEVSTPDAVRFDGLLPQPLVAWSDQPDASSDADAVLVRAVDERLGLTRELCGALTDRRSPDRVRHSLQDVVRQHIFGIACGY